MRLEYFSINNFRSITKAYNIPINDITTIVGKNNEGKSNILKGLNIAMSILKRHGMGIYGTTGVYGGSRSRTGRYSRSENQYNRERDFPVQLRKKGSKNLNSDFKLTFSLSNDEVKEFTKSIQSYVNGKITISITIGEENRPNVEVKKRGKNTIKNFGKRSNEIARYISDRINITYIPAIRTDEHAIATIEDMLGSELSKIEDNVKYREALNIISDLQKPVLQSINAKVKKSLKMFMPEIVDVKTLVSEEYRRMALRNCEIFINDGAETKLEYKGDGVKSLVALSLLKDKEKSKGFSLVAIEEPESHLHPGAIHSLRNVIYELSSTNQIILSTHNPLFVNIDSVKSNIIVEGGKAAPAKKIGEIRKMLGIRSSDNLSNARFVVMVEGKYDEVVIKGLLSYYSPKLKKYLNDRLLVIDSLRGSSKLNYKLALLKNEICTYYVILDKDISGECAYTKAEDEGLLSPKNTTFILAKGKRESELEDIINKDLYKKKILTEYGVDIESVDFIKSKEKWSNTMKLLFESSGKPRNDDIENNLKQIVAESVLGNEGRAILEHNRKILQTLIQLIEEMVDVDGE